MAIYRNGRPPIEVLEYRYRRLFNLSAQELADEPADQFFTNLKIYAYLQDRKMLELKRKDSGRR